jgi:hypothetical protein
VSVVVEVGLFQNFMHIAAGILCSFAQFRSIQRGLCLNGILLVQSQLIQAL